MDDRKEIKHCWLLILLFVVYVQPSGHTCFIGETVIYVYYIYTLRACARNITSDGCRAPINLHIANKQNRKQNIVPQ